MLTNACKCVFFFKVPIRMSCKCVASICPNVANMNEIRPREVSLLEHEEEEKRRPIRGRRKERKRRSCWVKYWLSQEQILHQSHYYNLMKTLREKDPEGFRNYTRLQPEMFDELLDRIRARIVKQDTTYRDALEPALELAVTLRYLATGNSYVDLAYKFRVTNKSISIFVPEVCLISLMNSLMKLFHHLTLKSGGNSFLMNSRTGGMCKMPVVLWM